MGLLEFTLLQEAADDYLIKLKHFLAQRQLNELFHGPVDHLAVKASNTQNFEAYLSKIKPRCLSLVSSHINNRRIATAELSQAISFGKLGDTSILEIMEPRPEKAGHDFVGFEHIELRYPNLKKIEETFRLKDIHFSVCSNPKHTAVELKITSYGQEVKFTDNSLKDIIELELKEGSAAQIK